MGHVQICLLGPLSVTRDGVQAPSLSKSVRQLIALIAASGTHGIRREALAHELWGDELPESWKSAIRNRVAAARKIVGSDALLSDAGRFSFANFVTIDSWQLIDNAAGPHNDPSDLTFLDGRSLVDIEPCRLVREHVVQLADARAVRLQQLVSLSTEPLPASTLQALRSYQRAHPLDSAATDAVVRAHLEASELTHASAILATTRATAGRRAGHLSWIGEIENLISAYGSEPGSFAADDDSAESREIKRRAQLFERAARDEDWSVALEIATAGLPLAERSEGDPERLALLEQIPIDKLDPARQFSFCLTMARHLMYSNRDADAAEWARTTRRLAATPDQELLAYITAVVVGESMTPGQPIPLPDAFNKGSDDSVSMQSLQVAVMSHLERASFGEAAPLVRRFAALVEASADPYRRWHGLLLEAMGQFVDGHFDAARDMALAAFEYADLFGIVDAEMALIGQLSNLRWISPNLAEQIDYVADYPDSADTSWSRALQAWAKHTLDDSAAVHRFLGSYNFASRSFFTLPRVVILAAAVRDPKLKEQIAARLELDAGASAIWGSGVMHLGPVEWTLAKMTDDAQLRERRLRAAVECADRQCFRVWQVVCRLDLAALTGDTTFRSEAFALATTENLHQLVASYQG